MPRELPLAEAAALLVPTYGEYLRDMFDHQARQKQPALAIPCAEALVTYNVKKGHATRH